MTQIKATILTGGNHIETVSFPCSDDEIMRLTEQNEVGHKATVFINNLVGPKGLKSIEGTYANIHELNYLAKRMDSFDGTEMGKLLAAASRFDTRDIKQLINYTFNLGRITLIQNISDMQTVGVEHYMDIHGGCCSNEEYRDPKRAEEGRALLNSKRGIWTDYGLMFINDEVPWEEVYNGITFPEYLCGGPEESSVAICHGGRTEFVYPPCEQSSIEFALERLGANSLDDCHIQMSCSRFGKPLSEVMDRILNDEGLEAFNEVCHAAAKIPDRDLDKFTAAVLYNKLSLARKAEKETNLKVQLLLRKDMKFLDDIQLQMSTAREFMFAHRVQNANDQSFATLNRLGKQINDQGFDCRRATKDDIKRILSRYFGHMTEDAIDDVDGERMIKKWIIPD